MDPSFSPEVWPELYGLPNTNAPPSKIPPRRPPAEAAPRPQQQAPAPAPEQAAPAPRSLTITGPDQQRVTITAPASATPEQIQAKVAQVKANWQPQDTGPQPSWWQKNITGVEDPKVGKLPSVYSQHPDDLNNATALAATLGASDNQMADIVQKHLGDKFLKREKDANGYDVFTTRGRDGQEQKGYLNRPGLDLEDVSRGIHSALPYMATGGAAGLAFGAGRGLMANAAIQGVTGAATSAAGDVAQMPLGSEQGIEAEKALMVGALSAAAPFAGRAVGNAAGYLKDKFSPVGSALANTSRKAISRAEEGMGYRPGANSSGQLSRQDYHNSVQSLGHGEAMLGDMTQTLGDDTAALAGTPVASDVVGANLMARQTVSPDRIRNTLSQNIGPEINLPEHIKAQSKAYNAQAAPLYDQFYDTPILSSPELKDVMARVPRGAITSAQELARNKGYQKSFRTLKTDDPMTPMTGVQRSTAEPVIQGVEYDYIKRAIDDMAKAAKPGTNQQATYQGLARDLRSEVDNILAPHDPKQSPWAQARAIAGEGLEGKDAAADGALAFGPTPRDPHLVAEDLKGLSQYGQDSYLAGGRNKLRQVMGRAASNYGPKGDSAARRSLNSEFSRENLEQIAGPRAAGTITNRIDAENRMAELYDKAFGNSKTARMLESKKRWPTPTEGKFASEAGKKGPLGLATEYALRIGDAFMGGAMKKSEARAALDGARMLTATGPERDAMVNALFDHIEARQAGTISAAKYERLVRALIGSSRGAVPQLAN